MTGTGVSVPCGQVNSVCIAVETVDFWLRCVVAVVEPETTEAAVRLEEVFVDCSERAALEENYQQTKYYLELGGEY